MEAWINARWTDEAPETGLVGPLSKDAYFAFVESVDAFSSFEGVENPPDWLNSLRVDRKQDALETPHWVVWLDCVKADLFARLEWRLPPWNPDIEDHAQSRRLQILDIPREMFRVAVLLLSDKEQAEDLARGQFVEAAWHRITMGPKLVGIPVVAAEDFDLIGGEREQIRHHGQCTEEERSSLVQVFNFDFIAEAEFGGDEGGDSGPGKPEDPGGGPLETDERALLPYVSNPFEVR
jgi:hypothetical protein